MLAMLRILGCAALITFGVAALAAPTQSEIAAHKALLAQDLRLAIIGHRLTMGNAEFCDDKEARTGIIWHDLAQYPDAETAKASFGFEMPISAASVVPNSAAAKAGVQAGDGVITISGRPWSIFTPNGFKPEKGGYARLAAFKMAQKQHLENDGNFQLFLRRAGQGVYADIPAEIGCASDFQIDTGGGKNAGANGHMVTISLKLSYLVKEEDLLAAVVAHELAHNILRHRAYLDAIKVKRGIGRMFGKSKKNIRATEIEADRLSVWLLANAGYDPQSAIDFWKKYGRKLGKGIFSAGTHLRWKKRVAILEQEIAEMAQMPTMNGKRPFPEYAEFGVANMPASSK